jgi:GNAT superfamily N-acetyltransferase
MNEPVNIEWHEGPIGPEKLDEISKLFVVVDEEFGDKPWWFDVRAAGVEGAATNIDQTWYGHVIATTPLGVIVGFGAMSKPLENSVELSRIMVHPNWRGQGIGAALIDKLKSVANDLNIMPWVDVLETSKGAIRLYSRMGFQTVSYQYGRDSGRLARQMRCKNLTP